MVARLGLLLTVLTLVPSCTKDDSKAAEPVTATTQGTGGIPDSPGDSGEGAAKSPGGGVADATPKTAPTPPPVEAPVATQSFIVKTKDLKVRSEPNTKGSVVRKLHKGEKISAISCDDHWCKLADGEFVSDKFLKPAK